MAWVPAAIAGVGAIGSVVGNLLGNKGSIKKQKEAEAFDERMASTQHQREVADLDAAGLNPMLSGMGGQGNAAPTVQPAQQQDYADTAAKVTTSALTALQMSNLKSQGKLLDAQADNASAQAANTRASTEQIIPASAAQSASASQNLDAQAQVAAQTFKNLQADYDIKMRDVENKDLTNAQLKAIQPLLLQYQTYVNQAQKLGLSQSEVDAKFASQVGAAPKWIQLLRGMLETAKASR